MKILRVRWLLCLLAAVLSFNVMLGSAVADDKKKEGKKEVSAEQRAAKMKKMFEKKDANVDGKLSFEEFAPKPKKAPEDAAKAEKRLANLKKRFSKLDKDGDQMLSLKEFSAVAKKAPKAGKKQKKQQS